MSETDRTPDAWTSHRGLIIHEPIITSKGWNGRWAHRLHTEALPLWAWVVMLAAAFAMSVAWPPL